MSLTKYINKTTLMLVLIVSVVFAFVAATSIVSAQAPDFSTGGTQENLIGGSEAVDENNTVDGAGDAVNDTVKLVINAFSWVVGIISVIMIIVGGVKYITSSGDSGNVTGAKNTILYAIIGLVIVAMAQIIVQFVLGQLVD